ncbi:hypothetical protein AB0E69_36015 [Kribbella sp. NPDC026611]|uniref:hypothetical protein n=1 Tax=Kribbella sp. NPDC026611 TaxID=3154911 RepID=UPI0033C9CE55
MKKLLGAALAGVTAVAGMVGAAPAQASVSACDLYVASGVYSSAEMLYVAVSLDGCSTDVREVRVELWRADNPNGPFTLYDWTHPYAGGGAWFGPGTDCGYWKGVAYWQDQVESTPDINFGCS